MLQKWMHEHPDEPAPRAIGKHAFTLEGEQGERIVRPYGLWMLQRARRFYLSLDEGSRRSADAMFEAVGGKAFIAFPDPPPLARHGMSVKPDR